MGKRELTNLIVSVLKRATVRELRIIYQFAASLVK